MFLILQPQRGELGLKISELKGFMKYLDRANLPLIIG